MVIANFVVYVVREYRYHVLVSIMIKMVNSSSFIYNVTHHIRWRRIDNGRRYDVWHVTMVMIFRNPKLLVAVEPAHSCEVDVTSQNCNSDGLFRS